MLAESHNHARKSRISGSGEQRPHKVRVYQRPMGQRMGFYSVWWRTPLRGHSAWGVGCVVGGIASQCVTAWLAKQIGTCKRVAAAVLPRRAPNDGCTPLGKNALENNVQMNVKNAATVHR